MIDIDEFKAGTIPTANPSIFRAFVLRSLADGSTTVLWNAVVGKTYQVQYLDRLSGSDWISLAGAVTADSPTAAKADNTSGNTAQRFYRVIQLD